MCLLVNVAFQSTLNTCLHTLVNVLFQFVDIEERDSFFIIIIHKSNQIQYNSILYNIQKRKTEKV